MDFMWIIY